MYRVYMYTVVQLGGGGGGGGRGEGEEGFK